jgi:hypothetical protein
MAVGMGPMGSARWADVNPHAVPFLKTSLPRGCPVTSADHLRKAGNTGEVSLNLGTLI